MVDGATLGRTATGIESAAVVAGGRAVVDDMDTPRGSQRTDAGVGFGARNWPSSSTLNGLAGVGLSLGMGLGLGLGLGLGGLWAGLWATASGEEASGGRERPCRADPTEQNDAQRPVDGGDVFGDDVVVVKATPAALRGRSCARRRRRRRGRRSGRAEKNDDQGRDRSSAQLSSEAEAEEPRVRADASHVRSRLADQPCRLVLCPSSLHIPSSTHPSSLLTSLRSRSRSRSRSGPGPPPPPLHLLSPYVVHPSPPPEILPPPPTQFPALRPPPTARCSCKSSAQTPPSLQSIYAIRSAPSQCSRATVACQPSVHLAGAAEPATQLPPSPAAGLFLGSPTRLCSISSSRHLQCSCPNPRAAAREPMAAPL
ncbi:hypothetical protein IWX90DRAFT_499981 [Phyllosticta citrichinensis]|uniref:Uncharacterized protein n=1 Tax=Phyllosticta citrichinensis TaxID=1130410 RepID=A0ABR1XZX1_9PEZI